MTKNEMLNELQRLRKAVYETTDFNTNLKITKRHGELLELSNVNVTANGQVRHYLTKTANKTQVDDFLTQYINAIYDVLGYCL